MERVKRYIIGNGWVMRSEDSKAKIVLQLAENVREIQEFQHSEGTQIASADTDHLMTVVFQALICASVLLISSRTFIGIYAAGWNLTPSLTLSSRNFSNETAGLGRWYLGIYPR
jgi:hypothetical protein